MTTIYSSHLAAGTPQSVLASHCILAVVAPDDEEDEVEGPEGDPAPEVISLKSFPTSEATSGRIDTGNLR